MLQVVRKVNPEIRKRIRKLEEAGFELSLHHTIYDEPQESTINHVPIRGATALFIGLSTEYAVVGVAECSIKDQFCRARGTEVAFNRAIHELSHPERLGRNEVKKILENE
jgi:hypothetical protein